MGTRAVVKVFARNADLPLCRLFFMSDGYPDGFGKRLQTFNEGYRIVNGIGAGDTVGKVANGPGCYAAQLVTYFKNEVGDNGIGGVYLRNVTDGDDEYTYTYTVRVPLTGSWMDVRITCMYAGKSVPLDGTAVADDGTCPHLSERCEV